MLKVTLCNSIPHIVIHVAATARRQTLAHGCYDGVLLFLV